MLKETSASGNFDFIDTTCGAYASSVFGPSIAKLLSSKTATVATATEVAVVAVVEAPPSGANLGTC